MTPGKHYGQYLPAAQDPVKNILKIQALFVTKPALLCLNTVLRKGLSKYNVRAKPILILSDRYNFKRLIKENALWKIDY